MWRESFYGQFQFRFPQSKNVVVQVPSLTGSTVPIPGFQVEPVDFRIFVVFKSFSIFTYNRTKLKAGSWLNRSDQSVQSIFKTQVTPLFFPSLFLYYLHARACAHTHTKVNKLCRFVYLCGSNNLKHVMFFFSSCQESSFSPRVSFSSAVYFHGYGSPPLSLI